MSKQQEKKRNTKRYHYIECGLDYIYLVNGFKEVPTPRGVGIQIQDIPGLHRAIGEMLVSEKKYLTGRELRFLRHELDMTQQLLANLLGVDVQSVARWEKKGNGDEVPGPAQRLIRILYSEKVSGNTTICSALERLAALDDMNFEDELDFADTEDGWLHTEDLAA